MTVAEQLGKDSLYHLRKACVLGKRAIRASERMGRDKAREKVLREAK